MCEEKCQQTLKTLNVLLGWLYNFKKTTLLHLGEICFSGKRCKSPTAESTVHRRLNLLYNRAGLYK